jgi:hypothetical protein
MTSDKLAKIFAPMFLRPRPVGNTPSFPDKAVVVTKTFIEHARTFSVSLQFLFIQLRFKGIFQENKTQEPSQYQLRALYDFVADSPDELSFKATDIVSVIQESGSESDGWYAKH